ncbi:MAG: 50S ribosomal protein L16 [Rickettsiales bacterium]|jgi:large subunit ribosomal protein L16|nr:50S ribosomal protein L16 [Rickettsiales bacterium]
MLLPSKTKYRKAQKGGKKITGVATAGNRLAFGAFGIKALSSGRLKANQIEATRRSISKNLSRFGKVFVRVFPHIPVSAKPAEVRMGSGKGGVSYWMCRVKPGLVLFEIDGVDEKIAINALQKASAKLPLITKIIKLV